MWHLRVLYYTSREKVNAFVDHDIIMCLKYARVQKLGSRFTLLTTTNISGRLPAQ